MSTRLAAIERRMGITIASQLGTLEPSPGAASKIWRSTCRITSGEYSGSGFFMNRDGEYDVLLSSNERIVVTCAHCLGNLDSISASVNLSFMDYGEMQCRIIAIDLSADLAILGATVVPSLREGGRRVERLEKEPDVLETSNVLARPGEPIFVCGYPRGSKYPRIFQGIISGYGEFETESNVPETMLAIQAPVISGSSGGPVCDANGYLVGIVMRIDSENVLPLADSVFITNDGLGFAAFPIEIEELLGTIFHCDQLCSSHGFKRKSNLKPRRFCRDSFVELQNAVRGIEFDLRPKACSPIGIFHYDGKRLFFGTDSDAVELRYNENWAELLTEIAEKDGGAYFFMKGVEVVKYYCAKYGNYDRSEKGERWQPLFRLDI